MATRESIADPDETILTHSATAIDKGNGSIRLTIPARVRDKLGIEPGDDLVVDERRDHFAVRPEED